MSSRAERKEKEKQERLAAEQAKSPTKGAQQAEQSAEDILKKYKSDLAKSMGSIDEYMAGRMEEITAAVQEQNKPGQVDWSKVADHLPDAIYKMAMFYAEKDNEVLGEPEEIMRAIVTIEAHRLGTKGSGGGSSASGTFSHLKFLENLEDIATALDCVVDEGEEPGTAFESLIGDPTLRGMYAGARNAAMGTPKRRVVGSTVINIVQRPWKTVVAYLARAGVDCDSPATRMVKTACQKAGVSYESEIPRQPAFAVALKLQYGQEMAPSYDETWYSFYQVAQAVMLGTKDKKTFAGGPDVYDKAAAAIKSPPKTGADDYKAEVIAFAGKVQSK